MNREESDRKLAVDRPIECGETYVHASHGRVEVTGIWEGARWVDTVPPHERGDGATPILVRYIPPDGDDWSDERSATLAAFRDEIDR